MSNDIDKASARRQHENCKESTWFPLPHHNPLAKSNSVGYFPTKAFKLHEKTLTRRKQGQFKREDVLCNVQLKQKTHIIDEKLKKWVTSSAKNIFSKKPIENSNKNELPLPMIELGHQRPYISFKPQIKNELISIESVTINFKEHFETNKGIECFKVDETSIRQKMENRDSQIDSIGLNTNDAFSPAPVFHQRIKQEEKMNSNNNQQPYQFDFFSHQGRLDSAQSKDSKTYHLSNIFLDVNKEEPHHARRNKRIKYKLKIV